jgi:hypothetical protein
MLKALITFAIVFYHTGSVSSQTQLPDLIMERVSYSVVFPKPSPENKVKGVQKWRSGKFHVLIRNIGKGVVHEPFYVAVEPGNIERVNSRRNILFEDDTMTVAVHTKDYEPGTLVRLTLQPPRAGDTDLKRIDELSYDNNSLEFVIPQR